MRIQQSFVAMAGLVAIAGCSTSGVAATQQPTLAPVVRCDSLLTSTLVGKLQLVEGSIVAAAVTSREDPDRLWVLNTPPDRSPEVVAVAVGGEPVATFSLASVFESATDISLGPGPDEAGDYLYVTDLGPGRASGVPLTLARIRERRLVDADAIPMPEVFEMLLPETAGSPLAMLVDRKMGDIYLLVRTLRSIDLYKGSVPLATSEPIALVREASLHPLAAQGLVAAGAGPTGATLALRTAAGVSLWRRAPGASISETMVEPACVGRFPSAEADALIALRQDALFSIDPWSHSIFEHSLPVGLGEIEDLPTAERGNLTPRLAITRPRPSALWRVGEAVEIEAMVMDDQAVVASEVSWELVWHSCPTGESCVTRTISAARGNPNSISADVVGFPAPTRVELRATYTDEEGLSRTASTDLQPQTSSLVLESDPSGAVVTVGGVTGETPLTIGAIAGDRLLIAVDPVQSIGDGSFEFAGWADGGLRVHEVTIDETDRTVALALRPEPGFVRFAGIAGSFAYARVDDPSGATVFDLRAWVALEDWTPGSDQAVLGAQGKALRLEVTEDGHLRGAALLSSGAVMEAVSTARAEAARGERLWVRVTLDLSSGEVLFYTSLDAESDGLEVEWIQLGEAVVAGESGRLDSPTRTLVAGQANRGSSRPMVGKLFGAMWLGDERLLTKLDYSTTSRLTSSPPDFSGWGSWLLVGPGWEYVEGGPR